MLENLLHTAVGKISNNLVLLLLTGLTVSSSGVAGAKLLSEYSSSVNAAPLEIIDSSELETAEAKPILEESEVMKNDVQSPVAEAKEPTVVQDKNITQEFPKATSSKTPSQVSLSNNTSASNNQASCIVTIFSKNYDVQPLRSTHPGGDVFKCDTDMSAMFQKAHGSNIAMLSAYATSSEIGTSNQSAPASTQSQPLKSLEDNEDKEYEDEYENHYEDKKEDQKVEKHEEKKEDHDED